jgi:hypothetical protein
MGSCEHMRVPKKRGGPTTPTLHNSGLHMQRRSNQQSYLLLAFGKRNALLQLKQLLIKSPWHYRLCGSISNMAKIDTQFYVILSVGDHN